MVAFAVGGLLGDTLFHLLPEIFLGEDEPDRVRMVLVEPNRNLLLGVAVLVGFLVFVGMDKGLRIATGGVGHSHDHGHGGHGHGEGEGAKSSAVEEKEGEVRLRKGKGEGKKEGDKVVEAKEVNPSVKLGGLLNMMYVCVYVAGDLRVDWGGGPC
jgi:zinc transporter 7